MAKCGMVRRTRHGVNGILRAYERLGPLSGMPDKKEGVGLSHALNHH